MDATQDQVPTRAIIFIRHADGEDRFDDPSTTFRIDSDNLLRVSVEVSVVITQGRVDAIEQPAARARYQRRLGEVESVEANVATYAPGYWHRVFIERDQSLTPSI